MNIKLIFRTTVLLGLQAIWLPLSHATLIGYTNRSDFNSATSGTVNTTNFDSLAAGATIASGATVEGTTFTYNLGGFQMKVGSKNKTTSGKNYLGTTGDDAFLSGDSFTMTFAQPVQAVGLFIIGDGSNWAGDYTLSVTQGDVSNTFALDSTFGTLSDGGTVYFLGLVESDPLQSFTSATFSSLGGFGFPFNVDDIVTASAAGNGNGNGDGNGTHPVPDASSTLGLSLFAVVGLLAFRRRTA